MPTLVIDNLPPDLYDSLRKLANGKDECVPDEAVRLLRRAMPDPPVMSEEVLPPCELPNPGVGVRVVARNGQRLIPEPHDVE